MIFINKTINEKDLCSELIELLKYKVTHITSEDNYNKIIRCWYIEWGECIWSESTFSQSKESHFYHKWCVSLFDCRSQKAKKWETLEKTMDRGLWWVWYMSKSRNKTWSMAVFVLSPKAYSKIIEDERKSCERMIIPFIESWYKDKINIKECCSEVILIKITKRKKVWANTNNNIVGLSKLTNAWYLDYDSIINEYYN